MAEVDEAGLRVVDERWDDGAEEELDEWRDAREEELEER